MRRSVVLNWAGGEHKFALGLDGLRGLATKVDAGPQEIATRLIKGTYRVDDVLAPLKAGLVTGAGMDPGAAGQLVYDCANEVGLARLLSPARALISFAIVSEENLPKIEHEFRLQIDQLRALQDICDAGPQEVAARVLSGAWRVDDVLQIWRLGLIGAGSLDAGDAEAFVADIEEKVGLLKMTQIAADVITRSLNGPADDPVELAKAKEDPPDPPPGATTTPAPRENGNSASSMPPAQE